MANELKISFAAFKTVYFLIVNAVGQFWNNNTSAFEAYNSLNYAAYAVAGVVQGGTQIYLGTFPPAIPAGVYDVIGRQQVGGAPAETDPSIGTEDGFAWNGAARVSPADLVTSGQMSLLAPIKIARGTMVRNFLFDLVSALDHVTPLTSGVCSGQIVRDGGSFTALESGAFTEVGLGVYRVDLTSGDLLANTAFLYVTATRVSGEASDPRKFSFVLQRSSGQ